MKAKIRKVTMIEVTYGDYKDIFRTKKAAAHDLAIWMIREKYGQNIFWATGLLCMPMFYGCCSCKKDNYHFITDSDSPLHHKLRLVMERLQRMILWHMKERKY